MHKGTILIIDDEIDLCYLLKGYFQRKSYRVELAHNLKDGLEALEHTQPDYLFLDNNLPDGNGWQVAGEIVQRYPQVHLNLISAFHPTLPNLPHSAQYRVYEKPISFSDLDRAFFSDEIQFN